MLPPAAPSLLNTIGNTPIVRITKLNTGLCELYLKIESNNPSGSIKDRIALAMVEAAEREGKIKPGAMLVEATAGNTGLALAVVAAQKGYKLTLVIPDKMSQEKIFHLKAMGATVVTTRSDVQKGHPDYYQDKASQIAKNTAGAFYIDQFNNPANPNAHANTTGPEIWQQMEGRVDAVVCGVGSSGTLGGLTTYFKQTAPQTEMVLADPEGSILAPLINTKEMVKPGSWLVEGIGEDYVPLFFDAPSVARAYSIPDSESIATARLVLEKEGLLCGSSSGTLIAAALRYCREQKTPKRVVSFVCDSGNKYLSKIYNPYWLNDQGLTDHEPAHDLRDLISRAYFRGEVVWAAPSETLQQVYAKMRSFDISQVPVMEHGQIKGLINESDLLLTVSGNQARFDTPVENIMRTQFASIAVSQPLTALIPMLEAHGAVSVVEGSHFLGFITPIDFLNYLRKRTGKA